MKLGYWDLYKARVNINGETYQDKKINSLKRFINNSFYKSSSYHKVLIDDEERDVHITDENAINKIPNKKRILSKPNEIFNIGQYVFWKNNNWLITNIDCDNTIQTKGIIQKCDNQLNLYVNDIMYQIPCYIDLYSRSLKIDSSKYLEVPNTDFLLRIGNNELTQNIKRGDIYKIGTQNYRIVDISDILEPGLLVLKIVWIADKQDLSNLSIKILNGDSIKISQTQQLFLNIQVYKDNQILSSPMSYSFISDNEDIVIIGENNEIQIIDLGIANITVMLDNDNTISDTIQIEIIEDEQDNFVIEINGEDNIVCGFLEDYIIKKYNNGIAVDSIFNFSIIGEIPESAYELKVINNNTCSIKAKQDNYKLILRAIDKNDETLFIDKEISLITLF